MAAHYALGLGAIGRPAWIYWPMLVVDAGVVAALAHCTAGGAFVAARHAARRRGTSLDGGASPTTSGAKLATAG